MCPIAIMFDLTKIGETLETDFNIRDKSYKKEEKPK